MFCTPSPRRLPITPHSAEGSPRTLTKLSSKFRKRNTGSSSGLTSAGKLKQTLTYPEATKKHDNMAEVSPETSFSLIVKDRELKADHRGARFSKDHYEEESSSCYEVLETPPRNVLGDVYGHAGDTSFAISISDTDNSDTSSDNNTDNDSSSSSDVVVIAESSADDYDDSVPEESVSDARKNVSSFCNSESVSLFNSRRISACDPLCSSTVRESGISYSVMTHSRRSSRSSGSNSDLSGRNSDRSSSSERFNSARNKTIFNEKQSVCDFDYFSNIVPDTELPSLSERLQRNQNDKPDRLQNEVECSIPESPVLIPLSERLAKATRKTNSLTSSSRSISTVNSSSDSDVRSENRPLKDDESDDELPSLANRLSNIVRLSQLHGDKNDGYWNRKLVTKDDSTSVSEASGVSKPKDDSKNRDLERSDAALFLRPSSVQNSIVLKETTGKQNGNSSNVSKLKRSKDKIPSNTSSSKSDILSARSTKATNKSLEKLKFLEASSTEQGKRKPSLLSTPSKSVRPVLISSDDDDSEHDASRHHETNDDAKVDKKIEKSSILMNSKRLSAKPEEISLSSRLKKKEQYDVSGLAKAYRSPIVESFPIADSESSGEDSDDFAHLLEKWKTPRKKTSRFPGSSEDEEESDTENGNITVPSFYRTPGKSKKPLGQANSTEDSLRRPPEVLRALAFLQSLSSDCPKNRCVMDALPYRKKLTATSRNELVARLFEIYNEHVFQRNLPSDMEITWNIRMLTTAGFCYYKRNTKTDARSSRIELSTKVVDCAERARDTLLHELCHAASWLVHGYRDGHGPLWKFWANRATSVFPELPPVNRCHSYEIFRKYVYRCNFCQGEIRRHSKSIDINKKVCGRCGGRFSLFINNKNDEAPAAAATPAKNSGASGSKYQPPVLTPHTKRTPNAFALFVKEHFSRIKAENPKATHSQVMQLVSAAYSAKKSSTS